MTKHNLLREWLPGAGSFGDNMNKDQCSGGEPEPEGITAELELLRKTYESVTTVVKLGRRWLETKPGPLGSPEGVSFMFDTFRQSFTDGVFGFRNRYPESLNRLIATNKPLADALQFLDLAMSRVFSECFCKYGVNAETVAHFVSGLDDARKILGEVLGDLEAEEIPTLRPLWDSDSLTLWYGDTVCRQYKRRNPENQFAVLVVFQDAGWTRSVKSPFQLERTLRETIEALNDGLEKVSPVRFAVENRKPIWIRQLAPACSD